MLTSLSPSERKPFQWVLAPVSTSAYRTYLSKRSPFPSTVSRNVFTYQMPLSVALTSTPPSKISVDSHVQVLLTRVCLVLCFLLPLRDIFSPPGRGHPPYFCGCASDGNDGDSFRPCGFHSCPLGERARGPAMVPYSNANSRQARGDEPPSYNYLLAVTYHGSHRRHRQRLSRELE
jgi:hypothetical protein